MPATRYRGPPMTLANGTVMLKAARIVAWLLGLAIIVLSVAFLTVSSFIAAWLARGEDARGITQLTGRTKVWGPLLALPRDRFQEIFGFGISNSSFNGLPIDSNWLSSYQEQGLLGASLCAVILLFLLLAAFFQPSGARRALALFLVTYCLVASFTEDGFTDATPYLLDLAVAASLLMTPIPWRRRPASPRQRGK